MVHPNTRLQYAAEVQGGAVTNLLYTFLDSELANVAPVRKRFRANRSMREVESVVELEVKPINEWEPNR
jgi:hypothetical protein